MPRYVRPGQYMYHIQTTLGRDPNNPHHISMLTNNKYRVGYMVDAAQPQTPDLLHARFVENINDNGRTLKSLRILQTPSMALRDENGHTPTPEQFQANPGIYIVAMLDRVIKEVLYPKWKANIGRPGYDWPAINTPNPVRQWDWGLAALSLKFVAVTGTGSTVVNMPERQVRCSGTEVRGLLNQYWQAAGSMQAARLHNVCKCHCSVMLPLLLLFTAYRPRAFVCLTIPAR